MSYEKIAVLNLPEHAPRLRKKFTCRELFGPEFNTEEVLGFEHPTPFTPKIDPRYVFPLEETNIILLGLELKDNIFLTGHTGVGKTSLITQIAARLNYNLVKIPFDKAKGRSDLIGEWVIVGNSMHFQPAILVLAAPMPGTIILLDEWDTINDEASFVLHQPLDKDDRRVLVTETGGDFVALHPDNILVATANTKGQGDETGLYGHGTNVQNYAQLNRFSLTVNLGYMPAEQEKQMILKYYPDFKQDELEAFSKSASKMREAFVNGQISVPFSHRDLLNWIDKFIYLGDPMPAAKYAFLNRMAGPDMITAEALLKHTIA